MWLGFCAVLVAPSPKSHDQPVIGLVPGFDWSVNWTVSGADPRVGVPAKSAVGATPGLRLHPESAHRRRDRLRTPARDFHAGIGLLRISPPTKNAHPVDDPCQCGNSLHRGPSAGGPAAVKPIATDRAENSRRLGARGGRTPGRPGLTRPLQAS